MSHKKTPGELLAEMLAEGNLNDPKKRKEFEDATVNFFEKNGAKCEIVNNHQKKE